MSSRDSSRRWCDSCQQQVFPILQESIAQLACPSCGRIFQRNMLDMSAEWRTHDDQSTDPSRAGGNIDHYTGRERISVSIATARTTDGSHTRTNTGVHKNLNLRGNDRMSHEDIKIRKAEDQIHHITSSLGLDMGTGKAALDLFKRLTTGQGDLLLRKNTINYATACYALTHQSLFTERQMAFAGKVEPKTLRRTLKQLKDMCKKINYVVPKSKLHLTQQVAGTMSLLGLTYGVERGTAEQMMHRDANKFIRRLAQWELKRETLSTKTQNTRISALIYFGVQKYPDTSLQGKFGLSQIAALMCVSNTVVTNAARELSKAYNSDPHAPKPQDNE